MRKKHNGTFIQTIPNINNSLSICRDHFNSFRAVYIAVFKNMPDSSGDKPCTCRPILQSSPLSIFYLSRSTS